MSLKLVVDIPPEERLQAYLKHHGIPFKYKNNGVFELKADEALLAIFDAVMVEERRVKNLADLMEPE